MYGKISQHTDKKDKKKVKVFVVTSSETVGVETAYKYKDSDGKIKYKGFLYDVFLKMKENLKDEYDFEVSFNDPADQNYDSWVKATAAGKYDVIVAGFFLNYQREKIINYSFPFFMNAYSIVKYKDTNDFGFFLKIILSVIRPVIILLCLGIIFGFVLNLVEPNRFKLVDTTKGKRYLGKRSGFVTTISSFFGEMGFLSENSNLSLISVLTVIVIMITAFTILLIAQAQMTTLTLLETKNEINISNLEKYKFLGFEGNAEPQKLDKLGANVTYLKDMTLGQGIEYYIKNRKKYTGGLITAYTNGFAFVQKNKNLTIKYDGLGLEPCSWVISKQRPDVLESINQQIVKLIDEGDLIKICKKYVKFDNACLA